MSKFDWKKTLASVAPGIATALGGPMAGVAVSMATKALGIDKGDEGALATAVASGDTNVLLKLKEADIQFKLEMKRLGYQIYEQDVKDRGSARLMAQAIGAIPQIVLSSLYTIAYFWTLYEVLSGNIEIADEIKPLANTLIGVLTAAQIQIMNFWFGSSSGSKQKTDALALKE